MKLLLVHGVSSAADAALAAEVLPGAILRLGADLVLAVDCMTTAPNGRRLPFDGLVAVDGAGAGQDGASENGDRVVLRVADGVTSGRVARGDTSLTVLAATLPDGAADRARTLDLMDSSLELVRPGEPVILLARATAPGHRVELLERVRGRVAAVLGLGSGLPTADERIVEGDTAWVGDLGLPGEAPAALRPVSALWDSSPAVDALVLALTPEGLAHTFDRLSLGPDDLSGDEATFDHQALYGALQRAQAAEDEDALFSHVTELARRVLGHERLACGFRFAGTDRPRVLFSSQIFPDDRPAFRDFFTPLLGEDECLLTPDAPTQAGSIPCLAVADWKDDPRTPRVRCILAVAWSRGGTVPPRLRELVAEIHAVLTASLTRLQFVHSLRAQIARTSTLLKISDSLSTTIDLDDMLRTIMELTTALLSSERATVFLLDESTGELVSRVVTGRDRDTVRLQRFPADKGIAGWVLTHGEAQTVENPAEDPRHLDHVDGPAELLRNILAVPLRVKDKIVGVLEVANKSLEQAFTADDAELLEALAGQAANPVENARLHDNLRAIYLCTVEALASAIDAKDRYTHGHSRRVTLYAQAMAEALGWSEQQREELLFSGLLHDIGKIGVEDAILTKQGSLTDEERAKINRHPARGAEILEHVSFLESKIPGVRHHHERFDGTGYPDGLAGEAIPVQAQIICVADAFDAMTSDRPYRSGMEPDTALERIRKCSGTQFAPRFVELFERIFDERIRPIYRRSKDGDRADGREGETE